MSNWVKSVLKLSGIDIVKFGAGSTRSASTSKATEQGAPLDVVLNTAGWTQVSTFAKFYDKPIMKEDQLGHYILPQ